VKLLVAASVGSLGTDCPLPDDAVPLIREAGLLLANATMAAPIRWRFPRTLDIAKRIRDGVEECETATIDELGVVSDRVNWVVRMTHAFFHLRLAMLRAERVGFASTARRLGGMLFRFGLMFAAMEAVRSTEEENAVVTALLAHLGAAMRDFTSYGIWSPELIARALARRRLAEMGTALDRLTLDDCIKAAESLAQAAVPLSIRARRATRFDELFAITMECLPLYWAAVYLYYQAIGICRASGQEYPRDAARDLAVIEEHRVGALELFSTFGSHLTWRPAFFLRSVPKAVMTIREAMRAALLAARAEISIYPQALHTAWDRAVETIGPDLPFPEEISARVRIEMRLEELVAKDLGTWFKDTETIEICRRYRDMSSRELTLAPDWERCVWEDDFDPLSTKLPEHPVAPGTIHTESYPRLPHRDILERILGAPWPGQDDVRNSHV
jgi:hypothetical protein